MGTRAVNRNRAQWSEIIAQYQAGQESEQAFCDRLGFKLHTFRKWRYQLAKGGGAQSRQTKGSGFVRVSAPASAASVTACLTIHGIGAVRIDCPLNMDVESIARLARAVQDGR